MLVYQRVSTNYDHDHEHDYVYDHDHDYTLWGLWLCRFKYSAHIYRNYSDALCHYVYMSRKLLYHNFLRIVLVKSSVGFVSSTFADSKTCYPEIYWHSIETPCRMWTLFEDDVVVEIPNESHHQVGHWNWNSLESHGAFLRFKPCPRRVYLVEVQ